MFFVWLIIIIDSKALLWKHMIIIKKNIMIMIYIKVKLLRLVRNISGLHTQI